MFPVFRGDRCILARSTRSPGAVISLIHAPKKGVGQTLSNTVTFPEPPPLWLPGFNRGGVRQPWQAPRVRSKMPGDAFAPTACLPVVAPLRGLTERRGGTVCMRHH